MICRVGLIPITVEPSFILGHFVTNHLEPNATNQFGLHRTLISLKRKVTQLLQIVSTTTSIMNILLLARLDLKINQRDFYIRGSLFRLRLAKVGTTVCCNYLSKCTVVSMLELNAALFQVNHILLSLLSLPSGQEWWLNKTAWQNCGVLLVYGRTWG